MGVGIPIDWKPKIQANDALMWGSFDRYGHLCLVITVVN